MSLRKKILLALLALSVAGLVLWSFRSPPVPVSLATAERGPLSVRLEYEGFARVRERFALSAPVNAYMPRLDLEVGDPVSRGQVLLTLRPVPPELLDARSFSRARAAVDEAEATHRLANQELARIRTLFKRGDVSESAYNEAQAAADRALASLQSARALLEFISPESELAAPQAVPLRSPVDGKVLEIMQESAGTVFAGTILLTVGDPGALEVAVDVLSTDAVRIHPGMQVELVRWGGEPPLQARVRRVEPSAFTKISALGVEEQRVWVIADITSPPELWRALGDQYRVEASFILWAEEDVLKVPASAVFRDNGSWAAFVVEEGVARKCPVTIGQRAALEVQVIDGIRDGEQVVVHPDTDLADGARVEPR